MSHTLKPSVLCSLTRPAKSDTVGTKSGPACFTSSIKCGPTFRFWTMWGWGGWLPTVCTIYIYISPYVMWRSPNSIYSTSVASHLPPLLCSRIISFMAWRYSSHAGGSLSEVSTGRELMSGQILLSTSPIPFWMAWKWSFHTSTSAGLPACALLPSLNLLPTVEISSLNSWKTVVDTGVSNVRLASSAFCDSHSASQVQICCSFALQAMLSCLRHCCIWCGPPVLLACLSAACACWIVWSSCWILIFHGCATMVLLCGASKYRTLRP